MKKLSKVFSGRDSISACILSIRFMVASTSRMLSLLKETGKLTETCSVNVHQDAGTHESNGCSIDDLLTDNNRMQVPNIDNFFRESLNRNFVLVNTRVGAKVLSLLVKELR